jgi:hypothetical protein
MSKTTATNASDPRTPPATAATLVVLGLVAVPNGDVVGVTAEISGEREEGEGGETVREFEGDNGGAVGIDDNEEDGS